MVQQFCSKRETFHEEDIRTVFTNAVKETLLIEPMEFKLNLNGKLAVRDNRFFHVHSLKALVL